ncbi:hypothetical protein [Dysgonomonas sp. ZJ279]|uniref:hypothetical protein n=1 Tax=Dysgonomonas sp. ZJ279 TaxID=2709796 RepID=UPI0013EC2026|nr:hypothetical protein [Dysgonomonas sp. ZJ279]
MKKLNFDQKIGLGMFLLSISLVLKHICPDHSVSVIAFFQGFSLGIGFVLLISGVIQKRKIIR